MRRLFVGLLAAVASASACADWVKVGESMNGKVLHYLDPATIRKEGTVMRVVTLTDFVEPQVISDTQRFLSVKMQDEFDCATQTGRHLSLTALAGNMGSGPVVATEPGPADVRNVQLNTADEDLMKFVCTRN